MPEQIPEKNLSFADLGLPQHLLNTLTRVGYETPYPIQEKAIPAILGGGDVVGLAQTGTGKTAAFALPILAQIDAPQNKPQALVVCPTRELAIQVAEAFQAYAVSIKNFHVLPIYGGQDMRIQLRGLKRGAHVIVGTPGRLLDHLDRRSLDLSNLRTLVLDEADEMLRMGFNEDVEAILEQTPNQRQIALFSATMPAQIRQVANKYLKNPQEIYIETATASNKNIDQYYWLVSGTNKLEALTRILEVEEFEGMLIFVRTKTSTVDLSEKLSARGFSVMALNGDMNQASRQKTVNLLKRGQLDIIIATDVAARGLDVDRITHVINYDIPYDEESYIHRIGRTGRAGRKGKSITFVAPRERRLLRSIEKVARHQIAQMKLPSKDELIDRRTAAFKSLTSDALNNENKAFFQKIIAELCHDLEASPEDIAAALAYLVQKDRPLLPLDDQKKRNPNKTPPSASNNEDSIPNLGNAESLKEYPEIVMERFKLLVGHKDKVSPKEIVGAIANEAEIDGCYIGIIKIYDEYSTIDLPAGMPEDLFKHLKKTRVCQRPLLIERLADQKKTQSAKNKRSPNPKKSKAKRHKRR